MFTVARLTDCLRLSFRNKCQIIDRSIMQPGRVLKPGTLDFDGTPHQPFANLVRDANIEALQLHAVAVAGGR